MVTEKTITNSSRWASQNQKRMNETLLFILNSNCLSSYNISKEQLANDKNWYVETYFQMKIATTLSFGDMWNKRVEEVLSLKMENLLHMTSAWKITL